LENTESTLFEEPQIQLVRASLAKRFVNYLTDVVIFSFILSFVLMAVSPVYPLMQKVMAKQPIDLADQFLISFVYGLYMSMMEALLKGKTIGKYLTQTRAVTPNGLPIHSQIAFVRGLIRIIPFEQISIFFSYFSTGSFRPWHDTWSGSVVVDEYKSTLPKAE